MSRLVLSVRFQARISRETPQIALTKTAMFKSGISGRLNVVPYLCGDIANPFAKPFSLVEHK
jgi:hypothetical protein